MACHVCLPLFVFFLLAFLVQNFTNVKTIFHFSLVFSKRLGKQRSAWYQSSHYQTSLVVQWLRLHSQWRAQVQSLARELDATCCNYDPVQPNK